MMSSVLACLLCVVCLFIADRAVYAHCGTLRQTVSREDCTNGILCLGQCVIKAPSFVSHSKNLEELSLETKFKENIIRELLGR